MKARGEKYFCGGEGVIQRLGLNDGRENLDDAAGEEFLKILWFSPRNPGRSALHGSSRKGKAVEAKEQPPG